MLDDSATIGVVITTYNSPEWLEKVLWGYKYQSDSNFELIIADDGSTEDTKDLVDAFRLSLECDIHHVWQRDEGFRKTKILNEAIKQTDCEYLIFTDGDCIPAADFVAVHRRKAEEGKFLSGGYYKLAMAPSKAITEDDVFARNAFSFSWLKEHGQPRNFKRTKLFKNPRTRWLLERLTPTKATWNGMNSSGFKSDIVAINGFNEDMQYGGLDRELGERLINNGLRVKQIRYSAICLHLDHERPYRNRETRGKNNRIRRNVKHEKLTWTRNGILKNLSPKD